MCSSATWAMEVSSTSMKVARVTVMAITQGFRRGFHAARGAGWGRGRASAAAALIRKLSLLEAGQGRRVREICKKRVLRPPRRTQDDGNCSRRASCLVRGGPRLYGAHMLWTTPEERRLLGQSRRKQIGRQQHDEF